MTRVILIAAAIVAMSAASLSAAVWRGHTVKARLVGQIDASPCSEASCVRGIVGIVVDHVDVHDHVVRCAWPKPRVVDFKQRRYAKVWACGKYHWWRFR